MYIFYIKANNYFFFIFFFHIFSTQEIEYGYEKYKYWEQVLPKSGGKVLIFDISSFRIYLHSQTNSNNH